MVSLIIMLGNEKVVGGNTCYFQDGKHKDSTSDHIESMHHGKLQVGPYDVTNHSASFWKGDRGILSFYVNCQIFFHFQRFGTVLYRQSMIQHLNPSKKRNTKKGTIQKNIHQRQYKRKCWICVVEKT